MQFLKFISLVQIRELSYAISGISFPYLKTWTIICTFWNLFPFSKNVDYHMHFLEFIPLLYKHGLYNFRNFFPFFKNVLYHMQFLQISLPSQKKWNIMCNFIN